eukprot:2487439-Rhodomonas_salina.1
MPKCPPRGASWYSLHNAARYFLGTHTRASKRLSIQIRFCPLIEYNTSDGNGSRLGSGSVKSLKIWP